MPGDFTTRETCRVCGTAEPTVFLDLGSTPLANALIRPEHASDPESSYPLAAARCARCGLVQLTAVVRPQLMFAHYLYASSASTPLLAHFDGYAQEVIARLAQPDPFVVEIGSNDGVLLRALASRGARVLGIEPAANLATGANAVGLRTWNEFFSQVVAKRARATFGPAKAVIANNVLAHIDDLTDVLSGLDELLDDDGVFVAEMHYLGDLISNVQYDTIYHEHLSYFAVSSLSRLLERGGLELFDARRLPIHGGSLRIYAGRPGKHARTEELERLSAQEASSGLHRNETYVDFAERVLNSREVLRATVKQERDAGKRIAGLGATAKGNTLLNYCGLGTDDLEYIGDSTPMKQGLLTPGMHVPIVAESTLKSDPPDLILLLAWNFADAIVARYQEYLNAGGRFIIPIPLARILSQ